MKRLAAALVLTASLLSLAACSQTPPEKIADELGLDVTGGTKVLDYDTHSGNGDGVSCYALQFSDDTLEQELRDRSGWAALPMDETTTILAYGMDDGATACGPYLTGSDGTPLLPKIEKGYYRFLDRQAGDQRLAAEPLLERGCFNFTLAVYDADQDIFYYCRMDT